MGGKGGRGMWFSYLDRKVVLFRGGGRLLLGGGGVVEG